ncbi:MAG: hypothetical protein CSA53_06030 [Gammaproteobacteria bacterium]|nr:MAG: hypothetical protein CSA53_06030 [Gammaproteobacteria bacterium]
MSEHWSAYWASGALTSLPEDFRENYEGELAAFWYRQLKTLPDNSHIVDVCTGNLALPLLFCEQAEKKQRHWHISAVDIAHIDTAIIAQRFPKKEKYLADIQVLDNTAVESLNETLTNPVDFISSQYGLEYCSADDIAPVLAALLKPGGRLAFVAHATDSAIAHTMQSELLAYEKLVELGVFRLIARFGKGDINADKFAKQLPKKVQTLTALQQQSPHPLVAGVLNALGGLQRLPVNALKQERANALEFAKAYEYAHLRNRDVLAVSQKILNKPTWYQAFSDAGLNLLDKGELHYKGRHKAGSFFVFGKPE